MRFLSGAKPDLEKRVLVRACRRMLRCKGGDIQGQFLPELVQVRLLIQMLMVRQVVSEIYNFLRGIGRSFSSSLTFTYLVYLLLHWRFIKAVTDLATIGLNRRICLEHDINRH